MSSLNAIKPANERKQVARSRRLRRGLVTLGMAIVLPGAFTTSQASAVHATLKPCDWHGGSFASGTTGTIGGKRVQCLDGDWYYAKPIQ